ncbi:hypothetical protein IWW38_003439, partial [Coemansia aciculifera]
PIISKVPSLPITAAAPPAGGGGGGGGIAPNIGGEPVAISRDKDGRPVPNAPPAPQNFDPLEHENKLNEPAPEIHQDHLNSNSAKLDLEMKKKATTVEPGKDAAAAASDEHKEEHVAGAGH